MRTPPSAQFESSVFIALGSNLSDPVSQVHQAIRELEKLPGTILLACSSLYQSRPIGCPNQPDFINAVAQIKTSLAPHALLTALLAIENLHGRKREFINAPRTLDLDVLIYGDIQCQDIGLTIPHPRISQRAFVLQPLLEISPKCYIPGQGSAVMLLAACTEQRLQRI